MDISTPYYEDMSRISNSNIGWYLKYGPLYLYKKLHGQIPDIKSSTLEKGTMIHEYILQPEEFDKDYLLYEGLKPASDKQSAFCNALLNSTEIEPEKQLLSAYKSTYSIIGKSEEKMLTEATEMASRLSPYISALKDGRTLMSRYDYNKCVDVLHNIKEHKLAYELLKEAPKEGNGVYHEFHINWEYDGIPCKSLLDYVKFDKEKKRCTIIDLKTTSHLWEFEESIKTFDYFRQLMFYSMAAEWYIKNELKDDEYWTFDFYFIAIDNGISSEIRVFNLDMLDLEPRRAIVVETLRKIGYHLSTGNWEHSPLYYEGDGREYLDL